MGVVTLYGQSRQDPNSSTRVSTTHAEGRVRTVASGPITITNGNSATSKAYLGKVPSSAIILPSSTLYYQAITGATSVDIGFEKDGVNTVKSDGSSAAAVLASALDIHSAGSSSGIAAISTANLGQRVWEWLGYTRDPGVEYDIVATLNQAATATGVISSFYNIAKK